MGRYNIIVFELRISCSNTIINYHLSQKLKLIAKGELNHVTIILTIFKWYLLNQKLALLGGTKWLHKVRPCTDDASCVKHLRLCGAILVGKTNMHELGAGTSGINPHYG